MTHMPPERIERVVVLVPAILAAVGLIYWAVSSANTAAQTAVALSAFNTQVMQRFDRIDGKIENLPVLAEQTRELQQQLAGAKGDYASLDVRLRAIETNTAAVHAEATTALKRTTPR
jgi:hypothetical protein